jgi:23S rRNA (cytidine1920-2'-O)/16S rRNA (cytidine1409-2'-O)-methyltransferase
LVRRDLASSRSEAQHLIAEGRIEIKGLPTPKPASLVAAETHIQVVGDDERWVSRGAIKLLAALQVFPVDLVDKSVLDVGSSTGGFTEVALAAGAKSVVALDVGTAQLHESLRSDPRVISIEKTNFRLVDTADLTGPFPVVLADLSFISLCAVAQQLYAAAADQADLIVLVKPQFEAGRKEVPRGGVVRDQTTRERSVGKVIGCLEKAGFDPRGLIRSPIEGRDGNVEYLLWLHKSLPLEEPA